jgi:transcriptional regulator with XRE-family HTH domain
MSGSSQRNPEEPAVTSSALLLPADPGIDPGPGMISGIGGRIRALRLERGLLQRELAEAAGLSLNAVSLIERDQTSPTVATLDRLAGALDVPLVALFQQQVAHPSVIATRPLERDRIALHQGLVERLGRGLDGQKMEAVEITLDPGYEGSPRRQVHSGHELVYVTEGRIWCEVGEQRWELQERESLLFEARIPHRYANAGDVGARAVVVSWEPDGPGGSLQSHFS